MSKNIESDLKQRVLVIDGAMGTMIQRYMLEEADYRGERFANWASDVKGNNELLNLTRPDIIKAIHLDYLNAGADIIETNTFSAQVISMADYNMKSLSYELNVEAAKLARAAVAEYYATNGNDYTKYVAGAIGPTNRTASISPDVNDPGYRAVTFDILVDAYAEQIKGLIEGGVDLLIIETIFTLDTCKSSRLIPFSMYKGKCKVSFGSFIKLFLIISSVDKI